MAKVDTYQPFYPPEYGEIDLAKYDLPCQQASLEWWYYNCHLTAVNDPERKFSWFASFFRQAKAGAARDDPAREHYDAVLWALSDVQKQNYWSDSLLDAATAQVLEAKIDVSKKGSHMEQALLELAKKNLVPLPDRLMERAVVAKDRLDFVYDGCSLRKSATPAPAPGVPGVTYHIRTVCERTGAAADLHFRLLKPVVRHGMNGIVNDMYYYYVPRCEVTGTVTAEGETIEVHGSGWYDREFGGTDEADATSGEDTSRDALDAWTWFAIQLEDNTELSIFIIYDRDTKRMKADVAVLTDEHGTRHVLTNDKFFVKTDDENTWVSMVTYAEYVVNFSVEVPSLKLKLKVEATFLHQEMVTIVVTSGGFWEGRCNVTGTKNDAPIKGLAFVERKNLRTFQETSGLLKNVGKTVQKILQRLYPTNASKAWIDDNVLGRNALPGVDPQAVCDTIFKPVRALIDRGGKAWRSLILVSCISALSTKKYIDSAKYIAIGELLHVGTLIIDDIQDESVVRRGGPCVHLEFGTAHAINAGTNCYFMAPRLAQIDELPEREQLAMFRLYFDSLRAGHAGQGLDLLGLERYMDDVVETGDVRHLWPQLKAIHVYKTGGPAGTLARMASILAHRWEEQPELTDAMDNFGTQVGLAFQIVDDALNLRGFEGDLKEVGEDIREGKITWPVVKAMAKLTLKDRRTVWNILKKKTDNKEEIHKCIDLLNSVHAINDSLLEARDIVTSAWARLDPLLEDSLPKLMLRAFSLFLTERTY